jgi:hypothetical protein
LSRSKLWDSRMTVKKILSFSVMVVKNVIIVFMEIKVKKVTLT